MPRCGRSVEGMSTQNKKLSAHEPQQPAHTTVTDETALRRTRYLVVSRSGDTLVGADGTLHYLDSPPEDSLTDVSLEPKLMKPEARHAIEYRAVYVEDADLAALTQELGALPEGCGVSTAGFRFYPVHADPAGRARYGAALAKRDYLIEMAYSAYTGESAPVDPHKGIRLTGSGEMVFPRIEPAVMALIMSEDNSRVLLANNRLWPRNRFALIAGFVDPGENLEQAVTREVYEETGLDALRLDYRMSDIWPFPRSLMVCYRVTVDASQPVTHLDGEIHSARWFTAPELAQAIAEQRTGEPKLELPGTNAVARRMLDEWLQEKGL